MKKKIKQKDFIRIDLKDHDLSLLSLSQLKHVLQLSQIQIDNYKRCIVNYSPEKMKRSGNPCLLQLIKTREKITKKIKNLEGEKHETRC
jgi:hypothetical protein